MCAWMRFALLVWMNVAVQGINLARYPPIPARRLIQRLTATYRAGIQRHIQEHGLNVSQPIVVTAFDDFYNEIAEKWAAHNQELGVNQYLMVALGDGSVQLAREKGFPAFTGSGELINVGESILKKKIVEKPTWQIPEMLSAAKFLLPALLMQAGFKRVIFSEMDVFFFENPADAIAATKQHAYCLSMAGGNHQLNIGFMEFRPDEKGQIADMLLNFTDQMMEKDTQTLRTLALDQLTFTKYVLDYPFFNRTILDKWNGFAARGSKMNNIGRNIQRTKVVHFSFATPQCKKDRLNFLYDHPELTFNKTVRLKAKDLPGEHPDGVAWWHHIEC